MVWADQLGYDKDHRDQTDMGDGKGAHTHKRDTVAQQADQYLEQLEKRAKDIGDHTTLKFGPLSFD